MQNSPVSPRGTVSPVVAASRAGDRSDWSYASYEGRTTISADAARTGGVTVEQVHVRARVIEAIRDTGITEIGIVIGDTGPEIREAVGQNLGGHSDFTEIVNFFVEFQYSLSLY